MKPVPVLTLAALAVVAFGAFAEGIAPRLAHDDETAALKAQIAALQQRLSALEARVDDINKPRMQKASRSDEAPIRSDRLDPAVIERSAKSREVKVPVFPAERP